MSTLGPDRRSRDVIHKYLTLKSRSDRANEVWKDSLTFCKIKSCMKYYFYHQISNVPSVWSIKCSPVANHTLLASIFSLFSLLKRGMGNLNDMRLSGSDGLEDNLS